MTWADFVIIGILVVYSIVMFLIGRAYGIQEICDKLDEQTIRKIFRKTMKQIHKLKE